MEADSYRLNHPPKTCRSCGRLIAWRRKWARHWDEVRYCSALCRRTRVDATGRRLEQAILALLAGRAAGGSICPSDAARRVAGENDWRQLMEATRRAARRLVAAGSVEIIQQGRVVDPSTARGAIRIRAPRLIGSRPAPR